MENKSVFASLYTIDVNEKTEEKNGLTYLSWAYAWAEIKKRYPDASYEIAKFDGKPYIHDCDLGYMVFTTVTIEGQTHEMWLPVMDGANKAMKSYQYSYEVKNSSFKYAKYNQEDGKFYDKYGNEQTEYITKFVEPATMFDINKTIMRCLVKNIGMFGLGLYIYAGEDLPEELDDQKATPKQIELLVKAYTGDNWKKLLESNNIEVIEDLPRKKATELINTIMQKSKKGASK